MATNPTPQPPFAAAAVRYEIRRHHDGSLISAHCCAPSAREAFEALTLADLMGPIPPGPLEWAEAELIATDSGQAVGWTRGLVPLDGQPPATAHSYF